jgi:putative ABC transport system substrate-binding protein
MRRREFIALVGGGALAWPLAARAQRPGRLPTIGFLGASAASAQSQWTAAFVQRLRELGWIEGSTIAIEYRFAEGRNDRFAELAAEFVQLKVDIILTDGGATLAAKNATSTIPIVFAVAADPLGGGYVESLSRPGGNATGFVQFEYSLSAKGVELLKEVIPSVTRVAVLRDAALTGGIGQFAVIQSVAPSLGMEISPINLRDAAEIERGVAAFGRSPNGGLIVTASALSAVHLNFIVTLAARHKLPAVYFQRSFVTAGGLISYGPDIVDQYRRAAGYVDRILKGEKPANLPVQVPTKYELTINLKTAKALDITVPHSLLMRADEVIE